MLPMILSVFLERFVEGCVDMEVKKGEEEMGYYGCDNIERQSYLEISIMMFVGSLTLQDGTIEC